MRRLLTAGGALADAVPAAELLGRALAGGDAIMLRAGRAADASPVPAGVDGDDAVIVETSGSTGRPKRVRLSAAALTASAAATERRLGGPGAWLLALPPSVVAGLQVLVRARIAGTDVAAMAGGPFRPDGLVEAAARLDPSARRYTSLVPAQLATALDDRAAAEALRGFDAVLVGGQRLDAATAARAGDAGIRVVRTYGSSETAGGCVYDGVPLDGVDVDVSGGEVRIAGAVLASGYLGGDGDDRFVVDGGVRRYRTGDAGSVDGGRLSVTGRLDAVLVSGGTNVSLDAVEEAARVAGVADAVVVAAPHPRWGEAPVLASAGEVDLPRVRAAIGAALGPAARPDRALRVDPLPTLASGKPDRARLAALARDDRAYDRDRPEPKEQTP